MTSLQLVFVLALTALLTGVVAFTVQTVRAALVLQHSGGHGTWVERFGQAGNRDAQRWAYVAHRATGVAVFAFLVLHVFDVALYALSASRFDEVHRLYGTAAMRVFESLLLYAILFHTFNGLRLVLLDAAELGVRTARRLLHTAVALSVTVGTPTAVVILRPVFT